MFSLFGSVYFTAFFAAKIMFLSLVVVLHGLFSRHEFFTNRVFFQDIACRHLPRGGFLPGTLNRWLLPSTSYQPVADIDKDGNNYNP